MSQSQQVSHYSQLDIQHSQIGLHLQLLLRLQLVVEFHPPCKEKGVNLKQVVTDMFMRV